MERKNKLLDTIHIKIHAIRMLSGYKPSQFEMEINKMICEEYKDECEECKNKLLVMNTQSSQYQSKSFLGGLFK